MNFRFIDRPVFFDRSFYEKSVSRMTDRLMQLPQVAAVYQIGSVSVPGISDLDIVAVFKNGVTSDFNPLSVLEKNERYLFVHSLFGVNETEFAVLNKFLLQIDYVFLSGNKIAQEENEWSKEETHKLKRQIALEYVLKNLITAIIQKQLGTIKLRSLLLEANALKYDFELLEIEQHPLLNLVNELIGWRKQWFSSMPDDKKISEWFMEYVHHLKLFFEAEVQKHAIILPVQLPIKMMRCVTINQAEKFSLRHAGFTVPQIPGIDVMKIYKLNLRTNKFDFVLPVQHEKHGDVNQRRFDFLKALNQTGRNHFPYFQPMVSVLPIIK